MGVKPRRKAIDKLEQTINHLTTAAEILINDLGPYSERFPDIKNVLDPCVMGIDSIIEGVKSVRKII